MKKKKETEPKKKNKRLYIIAAVIVVLAIICFAAGGGGTDTDSTEPAATGSAETETVATDAADVLPEYVNVSNSEYARDGEKCIAYRVSVSADLSADELTAVFNDVCADDGYYLHTVYFYSSSDLADGGDAYDVAVIEETAAGTDPTLTRKEKKTPGGKPGVSFRQLTYTAAVVSVIGVIDFTTKSRFCIGFIFYTLFKVVQSMKRKQAAAAIGGGLLRVAIYIRVSTDAQVKKGDSLDEQKETCSTYIENHENMVLHDLYIDDGVSGQKLKRGDFSRLLDDVRGGRIDLIIFTKLDRWFRSLRHYLNTQETLEQYGVNWLAVSQPYYDTSTPQGRAFIAQSMTFAELEAQNDSERILSVFDYKYRHGEVLSGSTPLGFSIVNKHLQPNDDAEKALAAFQYFDRVGSLNATVAFLEREYGIVMSMYNLKTSILKNTKYIGVFRDNKNYCPAIVSRDLFDSVQRKLSINVKSSQKHDYIFSGLVKCACCGHAMAGTLRRIRKNGVIAYEYPMYRCISAYPYKRCINRKVAFESTIEKFVLANVKPLLQQYIVDYEIKAAPAVDNRQKRAAIYAKIDKLKELYVNDLITLDEFKTDKSAYMDQIAALPDRDAPVKDLTALRDFLQMDIETIYSTMTAEEKRFLWRSVIKEIRIDENRQITIIFL